MPYVYSTLSDDMEYALYPTEIDFRKIPNALRTILVKGGANVINKHMIIPRGTATLVSTDELKTLEKLKSFRRHKDRGFITVDGKDKAEDADEIAKDMTDRDRAAQLDVKDLESIKKPKVSKSDG